MKQFIVLIASIFFISVSYAQNNCNNNVSTDPLNPTNENLPLMNGSTNLNFLNQFDWVNIDPEFGYYSQYEAPSIGFNSYYCVANDQITIDGNITVADGFQVILIKESEFKFLILQVKN